MSENQRRFPMIPRFSDCAPADEPFGVFFVGGGKFIAKFCGLVLHRGSLSDCLAELRAKGCAV